MEHAPAALDTVRDTVRSVLERAPSWGALPAGEKSAIAHAMVRIGSFLAKDPGWVERLGATPESVAMEGDADPVTDTQKRLAEKPGQVGAEFKAGAMREGTGAFRDLVNSVDFPQFVSGLVRGVFNAVVDASVQQMKAYGEMLAAAVKTLDQFANDHVSEGQARDYVANRFPSAVTVETPSDGPARLRRRKDGPDIDIAKELGLPEGTDLDDEEGERAVVAAARRDMARNNQQLLATMVLLGINRIVITNGRINAKVLFDVKTTDQAARHATAEMHDDRMSEKSSSGFAVAALPWGAAGGSTSEKSSHRTSVSSAIDDTSESKAEMKAQLSGDVQLAFKSETFPLEKMLDAGGLGVLSDRARPTIAATTAAPGAPPPGPNPAPPPSPAPATGAPR